MPAIQSLLVGAIAMGCLVIGVFFLKFWKSAADRFFLFFATSFFIQGGSYVFAQLADGDEGAPIFYLIRLASYALILIAILDKNFKRAGTQRS